MKNIHEIKIYQKTTKLMIPKTPFICLYREIINNVATVKGCRNKPALHIQSAMLGALQEATEAFLVSEFESEYLISYPI